MFAGQGKLMVFGLGIGILSLIGLGFILVAPQTGDPIRFYLIGGSILVLGVGGSMAFYTYNWIIVFTKYRSLGMLLRPGWGQPRGEIWVLNQPVIELVKEIEEAKTEDPKTNNETSPPKIKEKDKEESEDNPQIKQQENVIDITKLESMIPDETKKKVSESGGRFHYYLVAHIGESTGREMLISVNPLEGMFEYFPEEVMINDFPRRVNIAFGTGSLIGQHDVFLAPLKATGWRKYLNYLRFNQEAKLYDSTRVWLVIDSNLHGWRVRYDLGLETPGTKKIESAMQLIKSIDAGEYIEENIILKTKIIDLKQKLLDKLTWEMRYDEKYIFKGEEDSVIERFRQRTKGPFWNLKNFILIGLGFAFFIFLLYMIVYQGAFSLETSQIPPGNNTNIENQNIPIIGGD